MNASIFKEFDKEHSNYLYCEELEIRILHVGYDNLTVSYEPEDMGRLYKIQKNFNTPNRIDCYMTKHMILKAFKKQRFILKHFQWRLITNLITEKDYGI